MINKEMDHFSRNDYPFAMIRISDQTLCKGNFSDFFLSRTTEVSYFTHIV